MIARRENLFHNYIHPYHTPVSYHRGQCDGSVKGTEGIRGTATLGELVIFRPGVPSAEIQMQLSNQ